MLQKEDEGFILWFSNKYTVEKVEQSIWIIICITFFVLAAFL